MKRKVHNETSCPQCGQSMPSRQPHILDPLLAHARKVAKRYRLQIETNVPLTNHPNAVEVNKYYDNMWKKTVEKYDAMSAKLEQMICQDQLEAFSTADRLKEATA
jgi:uncharacterized protein YqcC (DUF446 family)